MITEMLSWSLIIYIFVSVKFVANCKKYSHQLWRREQQNKGMALHKPRYLNLMHTGQHVPIAKY